jgi:hypothetical protein
MTAIEFMRLSASINGRIVSSNDLNKWRIAEARINNRFFVDDETGYGWAILPWELPTDKDRDRERTYLIGRNAELHNEHE